MNLPDRIATIRADYDHCFGCGAANPIGLQLDGFSLDARRVTASFVPRADYHGFSDLLHGGIVAAALDEIMAWTAILVAGTPAPAPQHHERRGDRRRRRFRAVSRRPRSRRPHLAAS